MMRWSDLPLKPSDRMLREFSGLWVVFFGALAAWQWWAHDNHTLSATFGVLAVTVGPLGLLVPALVRPIFVAWMVLAFPIGFVVSRVLLATLYFGVITPMALFFRLRGRDLLLLRRRDTASYWLPKSGASGPASYFRQY